MSSHVGVQCEQDTVRSYHKQNPAMIQMVDLGPFLRRFFPVLTNNYNLNLRRISCAAAWETESAGHCVGLSQVHSRNQVSLYICRYNLRDNLWFKRTSINQLVLLAFLLAFKSELHHLCLVVLTLLRNIILP